MRMILMFGGTVSRMVLALGLALSLSGCAAFQGQDRHDGRLAVTAAVYPLAYVAERVGGNDVDVTLLTHPGQEPHDLELGIAGAAAVAGSDVLIYERGLQASVDEAVDQNAGGAVVDAAKVVPLQPFAHQGHDHGGESDPIDPHFWQDPLLMADLTRAVEAAFAKADPAHAATYAANAAALTSDLHDLDAAYRLGLAHCARNAVVVSHDAFGYLSRYGLEFWPIVGLSPDAEPSPADLQRLQDLIRTDGITTVFGEALVSPKTAQTLAHDMGVTSAVLDPIEGLSSDTAHETYLSLMRSNLAALQEADGCQ